MRYHKSLFASVNINDIGPVDLREMPPLSSVVPSSNSFFERGSRNSLCQDDLGFPDDSQERNSALHLTPM